MIDAIRCGSVALLLGVLALPAGAGQSTHPPSALLPLETWWDGALPGAPAWAPVEAVGRLFAALRDGRVVAVNLADGEILWTVDQVVVSQPAVGEGLLFVAAEGQLLALDILNGDHVWSVPLPGSLSAPLVWNRHWLIATLEVGELLALRGDDGATVWRRSLGAAVEVPPSLAGDRLYVSVTDGRVTALRLLDGTTLWERQLDGAPQQVLPLDELFVGAADNNFYRLSRVDGAEQWRWSTGGDIVGAPAVDEDRVFFSSLDNVIWALDRGSGVQRWRQPLSARPTAGPSYVGDLLVFGGLSQETTFHDPSDGTLYGRVRVPTDLAFPPMHLTDPRDPTLVFVTGDGRLQALGPPTVPRLLDPGTTAILGKAPATKDPTADGDEPGAAEAAEAALSVNEALAALSPPPPLVAEPADLLTSAPASAVGVPPVSTGGAGEFAIQVGVFGSEAEATAMSNRLAAADYPVYVVVPLPVDAEQVYRVRIGDFPDRASANTVGARVTRDQALDWDLVALP